MAKSLLLTFMLTFLVAISTANLISLVTFPKNPNTAVLCSVNFDDTNQLVLIQKTYFNNRNMESKFYNFQTSKYVVGAVKDMSYNCSWYNSILTDYFTQDDILLTSQPFNSSMSRAISIFFSGSWMEEIITRKDNYLVSEYWKMEIIAYNKASNNLEYLNGVCANK